MFNLAQESSEKNDLADSNPDLKEKLLKAYADWNAPLREPIWDVASSKTGAWTRKKWLGQSF